MQVIVGVHDYIFATLLHLLQVFLGLDVGNGNHIGVLVIILCHNSP